MAFSFDPKYFHLEEAHRRAFKTLEQWCAGRPGDPVQWLNRLDELKEVMDEWKREKKANKAAAQQALTKSNTFASGSYQYIDTELAIPGHKEFGRFDLVAVRREGERYIPVIVELKYGKDAFDGNSGIRDHYQKMLRFLSATDTEQYLLETIRRIWKTKLRLGLLDGPAPGSQAFGETELMFAVTGCPGGHTEEIRRRLPNRLERNVWVAVTAGEGLCFDQGTLFPKERG